MPRELDQIIRDLKTLKEQTHQLIKAFNNIYLIQDITLIILYKNFIGQLKD